MIKYEYKVLKSFSLSNNKEGARILAKEHSKLGPDFKKGSAYVDYSTSDEKVVQGKLTKILEKLKYIKLINTIS